MFAVASFPTHGRIDVTTFELSPSAKAVALLENLRRTPMSMGGRLTESRRILRAHIERSIEDRGVPARLADTYGDRYLEYQKRVPMFFPHRGD